MQNYPTFTDRLVKCWQGEDGYVDFIDVWSIPEVLSDECEERGGEVDHALVVDGLVHADELLEGEAVGALGAEPQRRVHVLQHVVHLRVVDPAPV